jgi:hypothetical protein
VVVGVDMAEIAVWEGEMCNFGIFVFLFARVAETETGSTAGIGADECVGLGA